MMLSHFNSILSSLNFEREAHPSSGYVSSLQSLARRTSNESFEHFMPFSDSVFLASTNCSDFVMQLGSFVRQSFLFNSQVFTNPEDPNDPTVSHYIGIDTSDPNNIRAINIPCHEPAVLFRGGVAYGEVVETTPMGLFNNKKFQCNNLMGEAVVRAVAMEGVVKGPRIVLDQSVVDQLNGEAKLYVRPLPEKGFEGYYEILWPAMGYILENKDIFIQEMNHFYEIFTPAYNLWNYYKGGEVAIQYERLLELTVASAVRIYSSMGYRDYILNEMANFLGRKFSEDEKIVIFEGTFK